MFDWLFAGTAYAMGGAPAGQGAPGGPGGFFVQLIPLLLIFVVFYFLLIRPQQTRQRKHQEMLKSIKRGDEVYTAGGLRGKVTGTAEKVLTLEIADNVRVKVYRNFIAGIVTPGEDARPEGGV
ncbi:MAG TPA: preprotein translocase subunit YajC [Thermodesulfobacteriota bacterium]